MLAFLKAKSKTPKEFLFIDTGATSIQWIVNLRRINILKHIYQKMTMYLLRKYKLLKRIPQTMETLKRLWKMISKI